MNWNDRVEEILFDPELDAMDYRTLLDGISRFSEEKKIPEGSRVLIRADIDVPLNDEQTTVLDNERLASMAETLEVCWNRRLTPVIFGHVGRDKENTARAVTGELQKLFSRKCVFIADWLDEQRGAVLDSAKAQLAAIQSGTIVLLEHTRRYDLERTLWKASARDVGSLPVNLFEAARSTAKHIAEYYVFDALASHNRDWSSVVVPGACKMLALGEYTFKELAGPLGKIRQAEIIVLGGLKIDKLDALEGIVARGRTKHILCGGSIAMALAKAQGRRIGLAEDTSNRDKKWFITEDRANQASRILDEASRLGVRITLPVDFVLNDGRISDEIPADRSQMDIGPKSREIFCKTIEDFLKHTSGRSALFINGSVGAFEKPEFSAGTAVLTRFVSGLKDNYRAVEIYVGGGDGRLAFTTYGDVGSVDHVFTCGGTVLKVLGTGNLNYLKSLWVYSHQLRSAQKSSSRPPASSG